MSLLEVCGRFLVSELSDDGVVLELVHEVALQRIAFLLSVALALLFLGLFRLFLGLYSFHFFVSWIHL